MAGVSRLNPDVDAAVGGVAAEQGAGFFVLNFFHLVRWRDEIEFGFRRHSVARVAHAGLGLVRRIRFVRRTGERAAVDGIEIDIDG